MKIREAFQCEPMNLPIGRVRAIIGGPNDQDLVVTGTIGELDELIRDLMIARERILEENNENSRRLSS